MIRIKAFLIYSLILSCALSLNSCSWLFGGDEEEASSPVELKSSKEIIQGTEAELLDRAKEHYAYKLFSVAEESFNALLIQYPSSPFAEFAEIKKADARFYSGDYATAATLYEAFVKERAGSSAKSYALFALAQSHQFAYEGLGRDTTSLHKAMDTYKLLVKLYPESIFADVSKKRIQEVEQLIDADHVNVIRFYEKQGNKKASEERMKKLENRKIPANLPKSK